MVTESTECDESLEAALSQSQDAEGTSPFLVRYGNLQPPSPLTLSDVERSTGSTVNIILEAFEDRGIKEFMDLDDSDLGMGMADDLTTANGADTLLAKIGFDAHEKVRKYHREPRLMSLSGFVKNDVVTFADLAHITSFLHQERLEQIEEYNTLKTFLNGDRRIETQNAVPYTRRALEISSFRCDILLRETKPVPCNFLNNTRTISATLATCVQAIRWFHNSCASLCAIFIKSCTFLVSTKLGLLLIFLLNFVPMTLFGYTKISFASNWPITAAYDVLDVCSPRIRAAPFRLPEPHRLERGPPSARDKFGRAPDQNWFGFPK